MNSQDLLLSITKDSKQNGGYPIHFKYFKYSSNKVENTETMSMYVESRSLKTKHLRVEAFSKVISKLKY